MVHYMTKSMWTHACLKHLIPKIMGINMELVPLCFCNSLHSTLGRFSIRCWNIAAGTCFHSAKRALIRSGNDVVRLGLARSQRSNSSQRHLIRLRSELCGGQSSSSTVLLINHWTSLCSQGKCHAETGKGLPQTVATKLEARNCIECHFTL